MIKDKKKPGSGAAGRLSGHSAGRARPGPALRRNKEQLRSLAIRI
jgi:hypothetical protein